MTTIRPARTHDAAAIAALCGQLGYPAGRQQVVVRLAAIESTRAACVLVVEDARGRVAGWLHVAEAAQLPGESDARILGLVVAEAARGAGLGASLLRAAEDWARSRGAAQLRVRSRIERERAHGFYERAGYARVKTQAVFRKPLA